MVYILLICIAHFVIYQVAIPCCNVLPAKCCIIDIISRVKEVAATYFYLLSPVIAIVKSYRAGRCNTTLLPYQEITYVATPTRATSAGSATRATTAQTLQPKIC